MRKSWVIRDVGPDRNPMRPVHIKRLAGHELPRNLPGLAVGRVPRGIVRSPPAAILAAGAVVSHHEESVRTDLVLCDLTLARLGEPGWIRQEVEELVRRPGITICPTRSHNRPGPGSGYSRYRASGQGRSRQPTAFRTAMAAGARSAAVGIGTAPAIRTRCPRRRLRRPSTTRLTRSSTLANSTLVTPRALDRRLPLAPARRRPGSRPRSRSPGRSCSDAGAPP